MKQRNSTFLKSFGFFAIALLIVFGLTVSCKKDTKVYSTTPIYPEVVAVIGGTFSMGCTLGQQQLSTCSADQLPIHSLLLSNVTISKYEVTNEEFQPFLNDNGNKIEGGTVWLDTAMSKIKGSGNQFDIVPGYEKHPVVGITWYAAHSYVLWLKQKSSLNYQLPTEASWEFLARGGGQDFMFSGSDDITLVGWSQSNAAGTHHVGELSSNLYGTYDMSGNVWEWVADWYDIHYYNNSPNSNPTGPTSGGTTNLKVLRGGSWSSTPAIATVSYRLTLSPDTHRNDVGFRVAKY